MRMAHAERSACSARLRLHLRKLFLKTSGRRPGGGRRQGWRRRTVWFAARQRQHPVPDVVEQGWKVAAVLGDENHEFPPKRMARHDAEITADIGEHRADRP